MRGGVIGRCCLFSVEFSASLCFSSRGCTAASACGSGKGPYNLHRCVDTGLQTDRLFLFGGLNFLLLSRIQNGIKLF